MGHLLSIVFGDDRWKDWTFEILTHIATGIGAAALIVSAKRPVEGASLLGLCMVYQWAGWVRKKEIRGEGDTLRRDVLDYLIGFIIGLVVFIGLEGWSA